MATLVLLFSLVFFSSNSLVTSLQCWNGQEGVDPKYPWPSGFNVTKCAWNMLSCLTATGTSLDSGAAVVAKQCFMAPEAACESDEIRQVFEKVFSVVDVKLQTIKCCTTDLCNNEHVSSGPSPRSNRIWLPLALIPTLLHFLR